MQIVVQHITGSKQGTQETFNKQTLSIGRDPSNDLSFDPSVDLDVSSRHAQINNIPGQGFQLVDLGSTNGTFVNGQKVNGAVALANGSLVEFGKNGVKIQVRFQEGMGQMPMMQPGMMQPGMHPGMMPPGMPQHAGMVAGAPPMQGPPQKGARTKMFEAAIDKSQKDAKKTKRLLCCSVIGFVLVGMIGIGVFIWIQMEEAATRAWHAKDNALNSKDLADATKLYEGFPEAKKMYDKAEEYNDDGQAAYDNWEYDVAEENWAKAEKLYGQADAEAKTQDLLVKQEERARRDREALEQQKEETEARFANAHQDLLARIETLRDAGGDEDEQRELEEELAALEADRNEQKEEFEEREAEIENREERARNLVKNRQWIVCVVTSQAIVKQGGRKVATLTDEKVGSGVFVSDGGDGKYILTAKSLVEPHLFDAQAAGKMQYYLGLEGNYEAVVDIKISCFVPDAADEGESSTWMTLFETANSSITVHKLGHVDDSEYKEPQTVSINVDANQRRVEGVRVLKDNENNWALLAINMDRAFPDSEEGRAKLRKIYQKNVAISYQQLASRKPDEFEPVTLMGITADNRIVPFDEKVQSLSPISLDERFDPFFVGAPLFDSSSRVLGIIVREDAAGQMSGIAASKIKIN